MAPLQQLEERAAGLDSLIVAAKANQKESSRLVAEAVEPVVVEERLPWLEKQVRGPKFELLMALIICINMLTLAAHLEWEGQQYAYELGLRSDDASWSSVAVAFEVAEKVFTGMYALELGIHIWAHGMPFFMQTFHVVDAVIVIACCVQSFIVSPPSSGGGMTLSALRIMRAFRVFRITKLVEFTDDNLREMRVLVRTIMLSMRSVVWSVLLIGGIIVAAGVLMVQLASPFIVDTSVGMDQRKWLFQMFGTTSRSVYTMFESTFTGGWRVYTRPVFEDYSAAFALFWVPYIVCVNFAVMRVVAALFLKQTMAIA